MNGQGVDLGSRKQQIVLAVLLCNANSLVPVESLLEALWGDEPPKTARKNIQVYVSGLRGLVSAGSRTRISYQTGGYVFHAHSSELDSLSFEQQARTGQKLRHAERPAVVAEALAGALDLWRGQPLDGLRNVPLLGATAQRLERQFLAVFEDWAEAAITAGAGEAAIERITAIAAEHPLRERLRALQMAALCQAGRRSEALAVYDELRQALAHDLGLSPSPAVVRLYQSLLDEREPPEFWRAASPQHRQAPRRQAQRRPAPRGQAQRGQAQRGQAQGGQAQRRQAPLSLLPWDPPAFTGQQAPMRRLTDALVRHGHRLVVVSGPLGAGKTALAGHAAHQLGEAFPDGRFFVRLRGEDGTLRDIAEVVSELMWAVDPGHRPDPDGRRAWPLWLAERRALVVIDDARRESEVRPLLPATGDSAVIVTSRFRLAGLEAAYRLWVPAFSMTDALAFLGAIIGHDRVAADRHSAERIVAATGMLPLGLRLVAERLALLHYLPLAEYATRIASAPALLNELTTCDAGLRLRLAQAIEELPQAARQAVPSLGLLPSPVFTLRQAATVLETDEDSAARVLEHLLESSVVAVRNLEGVERAGYAITYELPLLPYAYAREQAELRSTL